MVIWLLFPSASPQTSIYFVQDQVKSSSSLTLPLSQSSSASSQDFNTGLLPWEERALREPTPPPVEAEDPILIPEEAPEILEAVDPLPETEVPDLEDSGEDMIEYKVLRSNNM